MKLPTLILLAALASSASCQSPNKSNPIQSEQTTAKADSGAPKAPNGKKYLSQPLIKSIYTADPSAHVFNGKIYVYPSHDYDAGIADNDNGDQYAMKDFHVLSMDSIDGKVTDNGIALDINNIPWAAKQLWAPDAAYKNGKYYLYFPVKDKQEVFHIGVAVADKPIGPFKP